MTESRTGEAPGLPTRVAFTCRKRARSLVTASPSLRRWAGDQSDQVASGLLVFPLRVCTRISAPGGTTASKLSRPQLETVSVSFTFETKVPVARRGRVERVDPAGVGGGEDHGPVGPAADRGDLLRGEAADHVPGAVVANAVDLAAIAGRHQHSVTGVHEAVGGLVARGPQGVDLARRQHPHDRALGGPARSLDGAGGASRGGQRGRAQRRSRSP